MFFGLRLIGRLLGFVVKTAIFVAVIGAVVVGAAYALFNGDQYKARLSKRVVDVTGRALTVNGKTELDLTSMPPKIVLNDVRLKNARWGSRPDMARIKRVEIQLNPLRAISGGDSVAQVRLDGADVLLETNPQGVGNWALGGVAAGAGAIGTLGVLGSLGILGGTSSSTPPVVLSNPTITFRDGASGNTQTVSLAGGSVEVTGASGGAGGPGSPGGSGGGTSGGALVAGGGAGAGGALGGVGSAASGGLAAAGNALPEATFAGGSSGSHMLVAAASDNTSPCDGEPRSSQNQHK